VAKLGSVRITLQRAQRLLPPSISIDFIDDPLTENNGLNWEEK